MSRLPCLMLVCVSSMVASAAHAQAPSFQGLGALANTGPGTFGSSAAAVSSDGLVVGRTVSVGGVGFEAFRWTAAGGMVGLGASVGGIGSFDGAAGVSSDGSVIVGGGIDSIGRLAALRWTSASGAVELGSLFPASTFPIAGANGVSADGSVVVGVSTDLSNIFNGISSSFRWTSAGGMVSLGVLPGSGPNSNALAVSSDGSVIVGQDTLLTNKTEAFRWTQVSGKVSLGSLHGLQSSSSARAISDDGLVIVGQDIFVETFPEPKTTFEAFRWTQATGMLGLGFIGVGGLAPSPSSIANGVSGDGSIIVGRATSTICGDSDAFIWTEADGMRSLRDVLVTDVSIETPSLTDWVFISADAISPDGFTIVGTGVHNGVTEGWIATNLFPPPVITSQPASTLTNVGGAVIFPVTFTSVGQVTIEWRKDGVVLVDDGRITGATTTTLSIDPVQSGDFGAYACHVLLSSSIGDVTTPFALSVNAPTCPGDANSDLQVTFADITEVLANWLQVCP